MFKFRALWSIRDGKGLIWNPQDWGGTGLLNIPFNTEHLY